MMGGGSHACMECLNFFVDKEMDPFFCFSGSVRRHEALVSRWTTSVPNSDLGSDQRIAPYISIWVDLALVWFVSDSI